MNRLEVKNVSKSFPGVKALENVSLELNAGEVLGLLGENGAGKSTLAKILNGIHSPDEGELRVNGKTVKFKNPGEAKNHGIAMIHQELSLMRNMSVMENIMIGSEPITGMGTVDFSGEYDAAKEALDKLGGGINPVEKVENLGVGAQQKVEIARALSQSSSIFIMDEATSSLTNEEINKLFELIDELKKNGVAIIYITHKLEEVFRICDKITVLRNGKLIGNVRPEEVSMNQVVSMIAGKAVKDLSPHEFNSKEGPVFEVKDLSSRGVTGTKLEDINFKLRAGEILGITGLLGAGKSELSRALWGMEPCESAEIYLDGNRVDINSPKVALNNGLAHVPEDRHLHGLIPNMDVAKNITLAKLEEICSMNSLINFPEEVKISQNWIENFKIAVSSYRQKVKNLSGGNQQKVVLSKWLQTKPRVLVIDEPTRGIDVGAKEEIRKQIQFLAKEGMAVLLFSSEIDEVLSLANNILVLCKGRIIAEYKSEDADKERILANAMGIKQDEEVI